MVTELSPWPIMYHDSESMKMPLEVALDNGDAAAFLHAFHML